jgi:hypothetical protein
MGRDGRHWKRLIAAGSVVAVFAGLTALPAVGLTSHLKGVNVAPQKDGVATSSCPSGSEAVSGGFANPGFDPMATGPANLLFTSRRLHRNQWQVAAHNFGQASGTLFSYVYCDSHEPGLVVETNTDTILASSNGSVTAKCPRGSEAVSGGFQSPSGGFLAKTLFAYGSKRVGDRKWTVSVVSNDPMNDHKLKAFAYCDRRQPGLVTRSKNGTVTGVQKVSLTPKCPNGAQAFSGGYDSTLDTTKNPPATAFAFTSRRASSSSWRVSAVGNGDNTNTATETAFVYCKT